MANPKDEKGPPRPGEAGTGKRPYTTLDLQATEVAGKGAPADGPRPKPEAAPAPDAKPAPKPSPGQPQGATAARPSLADGARAATRSAAALAAGTRSSPFLTHLSAGALGALIVVLAGALLSPVLKPDRTQALNLQDLTRRLADTEAVLGMDAGNTAGLRARTGDLARSVRSLGEAQARLADDAKALEAKIGSGGPALPADLADRLAKLEQSQAGATGSATGDAAKSALATLDRELASVRTEAGRVSQRLDALRTDVDDRLKSIVRSAELVPVQAKLAWLDKELQSFLRSEADRSANAGRVLLSLELAGLKRVMDRGEPFAAELASVKKAAGDRLDLKPLERYMREGVPATAEIAKSFRKVSNAVLDAEAEPADASLVDRLLSGARSIVRVRKSGHSPDDTSAEATVARMDAALKEGRLAEVLEQGKKLPPKAALVAEDWLKQVEARHAVDQAVADIEGVLKSSIAGSRPTGPEPRR
jgi:hypothetical protein